jgi:hypothetical protein
MLTFKRMFVMAAVVAIPFVNTAPASAGVVDCTTGYPGTLQANPYDPTHVTVYPQLAANGPVDYTLWIVDGTFGYANCVL